MKGKIKRADLFTLFMFGLFVFAVVTVLDLRLITSMLVLVLGSLGALLILAQLITDYCARRGAGGIKIEKRGKWEIATFDEADPRATARGTLEVWGWILGLLVSIRLFGLQVSVPLWVMAYTKTHGAKWWLSISLAMFFVAFLLGVYDQVLHVYWPKALLLELFKELFF